MREIVLDTETTGLSPAEGHRIVEIGCVEVVNYVATGRTLHLYINPDMAMPADAEAVHGLTDAFLSDKPAFAEIASQFLEFIGDSKLVIHNAEFDMRFLNAELKLHGLPTLPADRAIDTLALARQRYPGAKATLDALCQRFGIDLAARTLHGALLDAQLLASVYLELRGGRQRGLTLADGSAVTASDRSTAARIYRAPRTHGPTADEIAAHEAFLQRLKAPIWQRGANQGAE